MIIYILLLLRFRPFEFDVSARIIIRCAKPGAGNFAFQIWRHTNVILMEPSQILLILGENLIKFSRFDN